MPLLLDTGILYALADADDHWHERARDFLAGSREALLVPVTVLPEVSYLLRSRLGPEVEGSFVSSLVAGELSIEPLKLVDVERAAELLTRYPQIGLVDATVVAMAERLRLRSLVTTDRRHFGMVRPAHVESFELLP